MKIENDPSVYESYEFEPRNPNLCIVCNKESADRSVNEESQICTGCREKCIKYPYPKWILAIFAGIILLLIVSSFNINSSIKDYKLYKDAETQFFNRCYSDAENAYFELSNKYEKSIPIAIGLFESAMMAGDYEFAGIIFEERIVGRNLNDSEYNKVMRHYDYLDSYFSTLNRIDEIYAANENASVEQFKDKLIEELNGMVDKPEYSKSLVLFNLGLLAENTGDALVLLNEAYKAEPDYSNYILSYIGNLHRNSGDFEGAEKFYKDALEFNKTDAAAIRGMAVLELLKGDKAKGLELARRALEIHPYETHIPETVVIALCENGKRDEAINLMEEYKNDEYVYEFDADLEKYLNGQISINDYYVENEG